MALIPFIVYLIFFEYESGFYAFIFVSVTCILYNDYNRFKKNRTIPITILPKKSNKIINRLFFKTIADLCPWVRIAFFIFKHVNTTQDSIFVIVVGKTWP